MVAGKLDPTLLCNVGFVGAEDLFGAVLEIPDAHE